MSLRAFQIPLLLLSALASARAGDGNRLAYLDGSDPYAVGLRSAKLTTPQWVGEEGVEAVVVLAIDDMADNAAKYEAYLRPIFDRLKAIDGRAPVSLMTCRIDPKDPTVAGWIKEGANLDVHTLGHAHPLLQRGDFAEAQRQVFGGIDLLAQVPGNVPVASRMPYCDSQNTPSPRFFAEILNKTSPGGRHLGIDSSIFHLFTPDDPDLPRELVQDADGREKFRKYLPFPSYVNTIENYPYPYVVGRLAWEFPCVVPSDWQGNNLQKPYSPKTVDDLKAALDATVRKQGVYNLVFHPHGWIQNAQVVDLIDHAVRTHGKKVKFLNFREAQDRLNRHLLGGHPLRDEKGGDNGVRLVDLDDDGYLDVVVGNARTSETRLWDPKARRWEVLRDGGPTLVAGEGSRFGLLRPGGVSVLSEGEAWTFCNRKWENDPNLLRGGPDGRAPIDGRPLTMASEGRDQGVRLRDLDGDGWGEILVGNPRQSAVLAWSEKEQTWHPLPFKLPEGARFVDAEGRDAGLRLVDFDEDGCDDLVWSNDEGYGIALFDSMTTGWTRKVASGKAGEAGALPKIATGGTNNGFWAHSRSLWWQNEHTDGLPDHVDRRTFNDLLREVPTRAKSPEASRRSIRVRPGFRVELVAAEPLVTDPIAFDWGADGRFWVLEMGDYPLGEDNRGKAGGRVRILEDADGDGKYDKATTFLDGLSIPAGIMAWRDGVLVACAPDILFAADRDGDGKAEVREVLFTGFKEGNPQHRVNGFDLGLDGWIYGANGDSGGTIRSHKTGKTTNIAGRDFRFRPDTGEFEAESGLTQYGRHRDDWGNWFGNNNPRWAWQFAFSESDLRRNPVTPVGDPRKTLEADTRLYPVSRTLARFNDPAAANRVTSANSPTPYRDDLFGPAFASSLFVSEPVHNLIHRMILEPDGATLKGVRAPDETDREFFASSDNWTRPTMLRTGPDGALYVADMYRAVIEHPEWIPKEVQAKLDLRAGHDMGRIYRIVPVDKRPRPIPRLDRLDTSGLVAALDSPNGWQRDTAQKLLLDRRDPTAVEPLRKLALGDRPAKVRVQALWSLASLGTPADPDLVAALKDAHPEIRRHALMAAEPRMKSPGPGLAAAVLASADDPDARVRFALAKLVGNWDDPEAGKALARVLRRDASDLWLRSAVLTSALPHAATMIAELLAGTRDEPPPPELVEPLFRLAVARPGPEGMAGLLQMAAEPTNPGGRLAAWQFSAASGLLDAAAKAKVSPGGPEARALATRLEALAGSARDLALDDNAPEADRSLAVRLLGRPELDATARREVVRDLLRPAVPIVVQAAAVEAIGRSGDPEAPAVLLGGWKGYGPGLRGQVLDLLAGRSAWAGALLSAIEAKRLAPAEVDAARRRAFLEHRDAAVRDRARAAFEAGSAGRQDVVDRYRATMPKAGNPEAGAAVFKRACASCHRLKGDGVEVGPDLATLTDRSPEALLTAILDPNRAFEAKYASYAVELVDGRVLSGLIASETAGGVTLRRQEGKDDLVPRAEIAAMAGSGRSLMPEGLENDLSPADLADLITFLSPVAPPPAAGSGK